MPPKADLYDEDDDETNTSCHLPKMHIFETVTE